MVAPALAVLAVVSGVLMLWQWLAALRFPLNARVPTPPALPAVSVLKPVKGIDPGAEKALASWMRQQYPGSYELIFGVESETDPAAAEIRRLLQSHPKVRARLCVCPESLGYNRKVSNLIQMARDATGALIVVSDADVIASPDLVSQMACHLQDPDIGLAHCLYRIADPATPATRWEAFVVNADFWSQVLQNRTLGPLQYALGAAMAVRATDLKALGGFEAFANDLADDNRLGRLIVALGKRTELCPVIVDCHCARLGWLEAWRHQLRWAVTIRVCQPLPHFLSILANGTFWPLLWMIATASPATAGLGGFLMAHRVVQGLWLEAHFTGGRLDWRRWWLPLLKDLAQVALWATALAKRHVMWRGHRFRVLRNGRLIPTQIP